MCFEGLSGFEPCPARLGAAQGLELGRLGWKEGRKDGHLLDMGRGRAHPLSGMAGASSLCLS